MSTLQQLRTYYANALHVPYASTPSDLTTLAADVDAGRTTFDAAVANVERRSIQTIGVAELSYQFFTGATLRPSGLDYLVSPNGPNPNNLNSAYYQGFNLENRYINFAVNLGTAGEGASRFAAAYGSLSLADTLVKSYTEIFGYAPTAQQRTSLLGDTVPNGRGGTYTRADYFADIGRDGLNGLGTKAGLVGWLLAQAAKEDIGVYAKAEDALIADLAPDGLARFNADLLSSYGPAPAPTPGATISFANNQSVAPDAADAALRSTANADTITGSNGLDAVCSVLAGDGADVVTVTGAVAGYIDGGAGNDRITVETLNAPVTVLGAPNTGTIAGGAGDDVITVTDLSGIVDGGSGDDTLIVRNLGARVAGIEHLQATWADQSNLPAPTPGPGNIPPFYYGPQIDLAQVTGLRDITNASPGVGPVTITGIEAGVLLISRNTSAALSATFRDGTVGADLFLDGTRDGLNDNAPQNSNSVTITGVTGALRVHVVSDGVINFLQSGGLSGFTSVVIDGVGRLKEAGLSLSPVNPTAAPTVASNVIDASASAGVDLGRWYPAAVQNTAILSSAADTLTLQLVAPTNTSVTLGAGADVLTIGSYPYLPSNTQSLALSNLTISGARVTTYATVTDFQKGVDHLDLALTPTLASGVSTGVATSLEQALAAISPSLAAGDTAVFTYAGDTYVYHQDSTVGVNTGDGLVRLVGVTGLTTGASGGSADIRYG